MAEAVRLAKRVAALVPCSRREAEQYIEGGWVRVDGVVTESPQARVAEHQQVSVDPKADLSALAPATFLLHQPPGLPLEQARSLLVPGGRWAQDLEGRPLLQVHLRGLETLLPLPPEASGLAVFSQDRRIVRKLTEDAAFIEHELVAEVSGTMVPDGLARLGHGLSWQGRALAPIKVSWQSERRLRFALKGIDPALVPWMCTQVGLAVVQLRRIRIGRLPMAALPPGQWRRLQPDERF